MKLPKATSFDQTLAQMDKLLQQVQTESDSWIVYNVWKNRHEIIKEVERKAQRKAATVGGQIAAALKDAMENGKVPRKNILAALDKKNPGMGDEVRNLAQQIQTTIQDYDRYVEKYGKTSRTVKLAAKDMKKAQKRIQAILVSVQWSF